MPRYYFNVREGDHLSLDDEGFEYASAERARSEAVRSLAEMAKDAINKSDGASHSMSVAVQDDDGPLLEVGFAFHMTRS
jgi:hypothetical protein